MGAAKVKRGAGSRRPRREKEVCKDSETRRRGWRPGQGTSLKWWLREAMRRGAIERSLTGSGGGWGDPHRQKGQGAASEKALGCI